MRTRLRLALRLYPSAWRRRYGRELEALLEDLDPGWFEFADVLKGALIMRMRSLATVPVASMIAGALIGAVIAWQAPVMYASSATIRLPASASGTDPGRESRSRLLSLERGMDVPPDRRRPTRVTVLMGPEGGSTLTVTYHHHNPAEAKRVTEQLATSITKTLASSTIVSAAEMPSSPVRPALASNVAFGSGCGLTVGTLALLAARLRRRNPASGER